MSRLTRVSTKKSSFIPTHKFSPPPVLQPKAEKQPDAKLPEWKPGGGGATNPLQRLLDRYAVQAKLTIGQPGDAYEQEADRVASQVMSMSAPDNSASVQRQLVSNHPQQIWQEAHSITPVVQRQIDSTVQMRELVQRADKIGGNHQASGNLESVEQNRKEELSKDPQTRKKNRKSIEEAEAILQAEKKGLVENAERPNLEGGDPNLDFKVDGPQPYKWADVKTPVNRGDLTVQAEGIGKKIVLQKAGSRDVLHIINLKNIPPADKANFIGNIIKASGSTNGIVFINQ